MTASFRLEGLSEPRVLLGDPASDPLEDLVKHHRRHTHEVTEALWVLPPQLDHKLVIQAELPPPQDPGSRPELSFTLSSSPSPTTPDVLGNVQLEHVDIILGYGKQVDPTKPLCILHGRSAHHRDWHTNN